MYKEYLLNVCENGKNEDEQLYFSTEEGLKAWVKENKNNYRFGKAYKLNEINIDDCFNSEV